MRIQQPLQNNIELVEALLAGNANPLIETPSGATAFSLSGGRKRVAATLAEACVLFAIDENNLPALLTAIGNGNDYHEPVMSCEENASLLTLLSTSHRRLSSTSLHP